MERHGRGRRGAGRQPGDERLQQVEGRNPVLECLARGRRKVARVLLDERARPGDKVLRILSLAEEAGVPVEGVPRARLDQMSETGVHNGVIAMAEPLPSPSLRRLLDQLQAVPDPFIVLVDEATYEHNLGAVLRSALGAGVHGLVIPTARGKGVSAVVQRVAMGAAEEIPVVRESLTSSLAVLSRAGFHVVGAHQDGAPYWQVPMGGPLALVLGGEDKGLTPPLARRCHALAAIPVAGGLASLNLSVAAGILMFERVRQGATGG